MTDTKKSSKHKEQLHPFTLFLKFHHQITKDLQISAFLDDFQEIPHLSWDIMHKINIYLNKDDFLSIITRQFHIKFVFHSLFPKTPDFPVTPKYSEKLTTYQLAKACLSWALDDSHNRTTDEYQDLVVELTQCYYGLNETKAILSYAFEFLLEKYVELPDFDVKDDCLATTFAFLGIETEYRSIKSYQVLYLFSKLLQAKNSPMYTEALNTLTGLIIKQRTSVGYPDIAPLFGVLHSNYDSNPVVLKALIALSKWEFTQEIKDVIETVIHKLAGEDTRLVIKKRDYVINQIHALKERKNIENETLEIPFELVTEPTPIIPNEFARLVAQALKGGSEESVDAFFNGLLFFIYEHQTNSLLIESLFSITQKVENPEIQKQSFMVLLQSGLIRNSLNVFEDKLDSLLDGLRANLVSLTRQLKPKILQFFFISLQDNPLLFTEFELRVLKEYSNIADRIEINADLVSAMAQNTLNLTLDKAHVIDFMFNAQLIVLNPGPFLDNFTYIHNFMQNIHDPLLKSEVFVVLKQLLTHEVHPNLTRCLCELVAYKSKELLDMILYIVQNGYQDAAFCLDVYKAVKKEGEVIDADYFHDFFFATLLRIQKTKKAPSFFKPNEHTLDSFYTLLSGTPSKPFTLIYFPCFLELIFSLKLDPKLVLSKLLEFTKSYFNTLMCSNARIDRILLEFLLKKRSGFDLAGNEELALKVVFRILQDFCPRESFNLFMEYLPNIKQEQLHKFLLKCAKHPVHQMTLGGESNKIEFEKAWESSFTLSMLIKLDTLAINELDETFNLLSFEGTPFGDFFFAVHGHSIAVHLVSARTKKEDKTNLIQIPPNSKQGLLSFHFATEENRVRLILQFNTEKSKSYSVVGSVEQPRFKVKIGFDSRFILGYIECPQLPSEETFGVITKTPFLTHLGRCFFLDLPLQLKTKLLLISFVAPQINTQVIAKLFNYLKAERSNLDQDIFNKLFQIYQQVPCKQAFSKYILFNSFLFDSSKRQNLEINSPTPPESIEQIPLIEMRDPTINKHFVPNKFISFIPEEVPNPNCISLLFEKETPASFEADDSHFIIHDILGKHTLNISDVTLILERESLDFAVEIFSKPNFNSYLIFTKTQPLLTEHSRYFSLEKTKEAFRFYSKGQPLLKGLLIANLFSGRSFHTSNHPILPDPINDPDSTIPYESVDSYTTTDSIQIVHMQRKMLFCLPEARFNHFVEFLFKETHKKPVRFTVIDTHTEVKRIQLANSIKASMVNTTNVYINATFLSGESELFECTIDGITNESQTDKIRDFLDYEIVKQPNGFVIKDGRIHMITPYMTKLDIPCPKGSSLFTCHYETLMFVHDRTDLYSISYYETNPVATLVYSGESVIRMYSRGDANQLVVVVTEENELVFVSKNLCRVTKRVKLSERPLSVVVTDVWGHVMVLFQGKAALFDVNGGLIKEARFREDVKTVYAFSMQDETDYLMYQLENGFVYTFESIYFDGTHRLLCTLDGKILASQFFRRWNSLLIVTDNGSMYSIPINFK